MRDARRRRHRVVLCGAWQSARRLGRDGRRRAGTLSPLPPAGRPGGAFPRPYHCIVWRLLVLSIDEPGDDSARALCAQHLGWHDGHPLRRPHQSGAPARDLSARPYRLSLARDLASGPVAIAGLGGGLLIQIVLALLMWVCGSKLHWLYVGAIAQALTLLLIILVSLWTTPPAPEQVQPFLWRPAWLRAYDETGARRPWRQQVKLWFAAYALAWCYIYWRYW